MASYTTDERIESNLIAVDPTTGEIKKNVHLRYPNYSGTLAVGGGLVFVALLDGTVAAFDDTTLSEMWKINVGSGFSAPPMTFETAGKQYIAIVSGPSPSAKSRLVNTPELKEYRQANGAVCVRVVSDRRGPEKTNDRNCALSLGSGARRHGRWRCGLSSRRCR
jgi:outer membrane protein assembly factor BamB